MTGQMSVWSTTVGFTLTEPNPPSGMVWLQVNDSETAVCNPATTVNSLLVPVHGSPSVVVAVIVTVSRVLAGYETSTVGCAAALETLMVPLRSAGGVVAWAEWIVYWTEWIVVPEGNVRLRTTPVPSPPLGGCAHAPPASALTTRRASAR